MLFSLYDNLLYFILLDQIDHASTGINCEDGLIIPLWPGTDEMSPGDRFDPQEHYNYCTYTVRKFI